MKLANWLEEPRYAKWTWTKSPLPPLLVVQILPNSFSASTSGATPRSTQALTFIGASVWFTK